MKRITGVNLESTDWVLCCQRIHRIQFTSALSAVVVNGSSIDKELNGPARYALSKKLTEFSCGSIMDAV